MILKEGCVWAKTSKNAKKRKRHELVVKYAELRKELKEKGDYEVVLESPCVHLEGLVLPFANMRINDKYLDLKIK